MNEECAETVVQPPRSIEEIDAAWLTRALRIRYPGTEVTSATIGTVIHGTATKVRLLLDYNDQGHRHHLPATMWLKAGYESHSDEQAAVYMGETCFYRDLAETLDLGCPRAFYAHVDANSSSSALLLEDLLARNAAFGHATRPLKPEQAGTMLTLLARLHARYWNNPQLDRYSWLDGGGGLLQCGIVDHIFSPANWQRSLQLPRGRFIPPVLHDRERLHGLMVGLLEYDRDHAHCLVHGDPHLGNSFMLPDGTLGFVDWQTAMRGYWAHDVAYFLAPSMSIADRRSTERDLIAHYVTELRQQGGPELGFEAAWLDYRRHAFYAFCMAICPPELQVEEVCVANAERICTALVDLKTLEVL